MKAVFLFFALLFALLATHGADSQSSLEPRCDNCWCIPGESEESESTCPTDTSGIWQSFPVGWIASYKSFQLTSPARTLQAEDGSGSSCYPFAGSVDLALVAYAESQVSPCIMPDATTASSSSAAVCAFVSIDPSCSGRQYTVQDFESADAAAASSNGTAQVIHSGPCGVCSNAIDLAVRMENIDTLKSASIGCGFDYAVGGNNFANLVTCYEKVGFTNPCATLWAHYTATNSKLCAAVCIPTSDGIAMNDVTQPDCPYTACYNCSTSFGEDFNKLAGIWRFAYNAGFNDDTAHPCDVFTRTPMLELSNCSSSNTGDDNNNSTTAPAPTPSDGGGSSSAPVSFCPRQPGLGLLLLLAVASLVL